jgi:hypothetical protein
MHIQPILMTILFEHYKQLKKLEVDTLACQNET